MMATYYVNHVHQHNKRRKLNQKLVSSRLTSNVLYISLMAVFLRDLTAMSKHQELTEPNFEKTFIKFETAIQHKSHNYDLELFIPYNYIMKITSMVHEYKYYSQVYDLKENIIVTAKRKDHEKKVEDSKTLPETIDDNELLLRLKDEMESITLYILKNIDIFLSMHIHGDNNLYFMIFQSKPIEGYWNRPLLWIDKESKKVDFSGIYESDAFYKLNGKNRNLMSFLPFDEDNENKKVVNSEIEFKIIYNLLEGVHKDSFKKTSLATYSFVLEKVFEQYCYREFIIHKKSMNVLNLFHNQRKENLMKMDGNPVFLNVPYMCFFNLIGIIKNKFNENKFMDVLARAADDLSDEMKKFLKIMLENKSSNSSFVSVPKVLVAPMQDRFIKDNEHPASCKVEYIENIKIVDSKELEKVKNEVQRIIDNVRKELVASNK